MIKIKCSIQGYSLFFRFLDYTKDLSPKNKQEQLVKKKYVWYINLLINAINLIQSLYGRNIMQ